SRYGAGCSSARWATSFEVNKIEKKCNSIAAEVLVPEDLLREKWDKDQSLSFNFDTLCRLFRVSTVVVARRALDLGFIRADNFREYYQEQVEIWNRQRTEKKSGGSFYSTVPIANGKRFTETVLHSVYSQRILMRDGARLLGTSTGNLEKLANRMGLV
ncbi:MAG: ImmA/IrrE family metallo-endopeptidase, partial [Spirochaetales bacterium]|nr:ImmA/IrrE family metallo-endopeptidase [Spirochaetales bacterium]